MAANSINVSMHLTLSVRALSIVVIAYIHEHRVISFIITYLDFLSKMSEHNGILIDMCEGWTK